ncbi:class E sortase [Streptomyces sp. NPDC002185]|uniref:class E sortase n=1 Tax=Streptomyces sp. NPDC002185 TaxID=3364636 RepID=UPI0036B37076
MTAGSPWFRPTNGPEPEPIPGDPYAPAEPYPPAEPYAPADPYAPAESYAPTEPYPGAEPHGAGAPYAPAEPYPGAEPYARPDTAYPPAQPYARPSEPYAAPEPYAPSEPYAAPEPYAYEQSPASPRATPQESPYEPSYGAYEAEEAQRDQRGETMPLRALEDAPESPAEPTTAGPGRAERRRAAKGGRGRNRGGAPARTGSPAGSAAAEGRPLSRVEARRAARAAKESVGVVASRAVGELFITFGVVMLLFVTYQLWWTNVLAGQETDKAKAQIEDTWAHADDGGKPEAFEPGKGFAIMYIPKLDVVVPIAEGISKSKVLDKGMVGHYGEGTLKTAMPADKEGNFAVAGHRNTHGEPFRYINQLKPGDPIVVETKSAYYTYEMASILPQTSPSNISVIDPVPKQSGFRGPGRYITLTTCTPEFTSTYRMIVWGKLVEERPRSKGKPQALVG